MKFFTSWLTETFSEFQGAATDDIAVHHITTDSRKEVKGGLFVPIEGDRFDGHEFLKGAIKNGAVAALWSEDKDVPPYVPASFPLFFVEDTLNALQHLAYAYRKHINPKVIGVTGSNGKTTTKDIIGAVMSTTYKTYKTQGNYNNQIGLPLTILSMPIETEVLVLEMGMNHFGEVEQLSFIAEPDYAVITNIGESHIEYLGSREGIAQAKTEILTGLSSEGKVVIDGDEPLLAPLHSLENVISCGFNAANECVISDIYMGVEQTSFTINHEERYKLGMLGRHNVKNASYAIMIAKVMGISKENVQQSLLQLQLTGMRFEMVNGKQGAQIINDAYNASPTSMKASIEVVKEMEGYKNKVLILGSIFELGEQSKSLHASVAEVITPPVDIVYTLGEDAAYIAKAVQHQQPSIRVQSFSSKDELLQALVPIMTSDTLILLKASRGMKFEDILEKILVQN